MRFAALAVLALMVGCPAHDKVAAPVSPPVPADVVQAAKATVEQWRQAYEVRSLDALAKLYVHDPSTVVVLDGTPIMGWSAIETALGDKLVHAKEIHVRLKDLAVTELAPTVACATATMTREIGDGITTVTENGALTLVLRRDDADASWRIAIEHYSYKRPG
ncbi:MAG TPA: nuclear transport factor 2 family protein [Kofleriaceae bacterium]|nr:nuclear transport factor 2 family protein [Kofleriaceae bacterium]